MWKIKQTAEYEISMDAIILRFRVAEVLMNALVIQKAKFFLQKDMVFHRSSLLSLQTRLYHYKFWSTLESLFRFKCSSSLGLTSNFLHSSIENIIYSLQLLEYWFDASVSFWKFCKAWLQICIWFVYDFFVIIFHIFKKLQKIDKM